MKAFLAKELLIFFANCKYVVFCSIPIKFLFSLLETTPVVPVPRKGSSIVSEFFVDDNIILCSNASGF